VDELLTSGQVSRLADVSHTAVALWITHGKLKEVARVGRGKGARLFFRRQVEEFLREREAEIARRRAMKIKT
jgi:MarR-like DNA-binding transcriptional regulator SgrR of sgrS sRNA